MYFINGDVGNTTESSNCNYFMIYQWLFLVVTELNDTIKKLLKELIFKYEILINLKDVFITLFFNFLIYK